MSEEPTTEPTPEPKPENNVPQEDHGSPVEQISEKERQTRQWAMFIHFSVLAGWVVPLAGIIVPVLLWQMKKDELPGIVPHAQVVMNWIVTSFVYGLICFVLIFIAIGVLGFLVLGLATLVFSIYGGIKANEGVLWEYPGTLIKLFRD